MASYDHLRLPHIEKYANQLEWKEGTLEEANSKEEIAQKAAKKLEKEADLEYCGQVFSLPHTQVGAAASSSTAHQHAAKATYQASSKGKEKQMEPEQPPHEKVQQQKEQQKQEQLVQQEQTSEAPISTGQ